MKLGVEGSYLNIKKTVFSIVIVIIILSGENMKPFHQKCFHSHHSAQIFRHNNNVREINSK
jgi:hypothetical protein